jgi:hypothetical protein
LCVKFKSIPFSSYADTSLHAKINQEFWSPKRGIIMQKANKSYGTCANHVRLALRTSVWSFNPFPSVVMEIPACTQKLNQEFWSRKRGIIMQKSKSELWDFCQSCLIITENKCVKFPSIPFSSYGDTTLHTKT